MYKYLYLEYFAHPMLNKDFNGALGMATHIKYIHDLREIYEHL